MPIVSSCSPCSSIELSQQSNCYELARTAGMLTAAVPVQAAQQHAELSSMPPALPQQPAWICLEQMLSQALHCAGQSCPEVAQRAQALLEQSLLNELRSCVARALSGLDLFQKNDQADDGDLLDDDTSIDASSVVSPGKLQCGSSCAVRYSTEAARATATECTSLGSSRRKSRLQDAAAPSRSQSTAPGACHRCPH